jgi:protoporphyrinogen oxidase
VHFGIIGGGISGLSAAYYLLKAGHHATVFESAPAIGGLASATQVQGVWVEKFYHCILPMDTALLSLVTEIGLGENIYWQETEMGFMYRGRLYSLTTPWDLLRFSAVPFTDRIRLGITGLYSQRLRDWKELEQQTAKEWLIRFCGERAFNTVWKPLLVFKFGDRYAEAPATYLWSRVKRQSTTRKDSQKEVCAYVKGGFKLILDRLAEEVRRFGGEIWLNTKVDEIVTENHRAVGLSIGGQRQAFDKIVSTIPFSQFLKLIDLTTLGDDFRSDAVSYQGVVCVLLVLRQPLSRYYWMPIVDSGASFSGVVETTNLIRREDLGGISLVYLVNYVPRESSLFTTEEEALITQSVEKLEELFPNFNHTQILESHVFKASLVEPLWTVNYSSRMPQKVVLDDSLFVLTTAQLYPEINSTSNCVRQVKEVFPQLIKPNG